MKKFHVYILYDTNTQKPIYIGHSGYIKRRVNNHRRYKFFDGVIILESFQTRDEALQVERNLIKFVSMFNIDSVVNALYDNFREDTFSYQNQIHKIKAGIYG